MKIKIYQVDAFTDKLFGGNPAAVCILDNWIEEGLMQNIAAENNLAETAFAVRNNNLYEIRWFTPTTEVEMCGHATLATAYVLFNFYGVKSDSIDFHSMHSGDLGVSKSGGDILTLDFPVDTLSISGITDEIVEAFHKEPLEVLSAKFDLLLIYPDQKDIEEISPDLSLLSKLDCRGVIVSAMGKNVDFVSRFFAPQSGIDEDPVTGSAHTVLTPYWSEKLNKKVMTAFQLSKRGGKLECEISGDRVKISGKAILYMTGEIEV